MSPESYHHGQLRQALIDAALALEPELGALGTSLRQVARRVGVSHAAVYHHFADKQALVVAVAEQGFDQLIETLDAADKWAPAADPVLDLVALSERYVSFALAQPSRFRFMFGLPPSAEPALAARQDAVLERFARALTRASDAGILRPGDPRRYGAQVWSMVHGVAALSASDALDGVPRGRRDRQTPAARARRARDLVRGSVVGWVMGAQAPGSTWGRHKPEASEGQERG